MLGRLGLIRRCVKNALRFRDFTPGFDEKFYLERNEDVRRAGIDPSAHFFKHGWREKRDPCARFSVAGYLRANRDVELSGQNPLLHFLIHGLAEGRRGWDENGIGSEPLGNDRNSADTMMLAPPSRATKLL